MSESSQFCDPSDPPTTKQSPELSPDMGAQILLHLKNTMFIYRSMDESAKAEVVRRCPLFNGIAEDSGLFQAAKRYVGWNRDILQNRLLCAAHKFAKEWIQTDDGQAWVKGDGKRLTKVVALPLTSLSSSPRLSR
jgi:hypothetical protein